MDLGEKGTILANFGPNPTLIRENEGSTRSDHPNSDIVEGIAPTTEIILISSNTTGIHERILANEERIGRSLYVTAAKAEMRSI